MRSLTIHCRLKMFTVQSITITHRTMNAPQVAKGTTHAFQGMAARTWSQVSPLPPGRPL